ncbi:proliferating cell nuclear antigen [Brachionus plicatilis]|uniref:DNA sliding clamp PCNA n=1 Tax=Brachionus plicatilis TaxID=10195 RepID=A0A3M7P2I1_BRAPC|nr:proliferating cell nuclear antigen [Brachionus plicatilis]
MKQAGLLKKIIEAIKDLISEATLDCDENGIHLQAMDSSHVSLVTFYLKSNLFELYRCEKKLSLGINIVSMAKILKCGMNDDTLILEASDPGDLLNFRFESRRGHKVGSFELRLMNLDMERLSIPDTEYSCIIEMACAEFSKVCHDLFTIGDSITIKCGKQGVNFITLGDLGTGNVRLKLGTTVNDNDEDAFAIKINISKSLSLTFSLRYLIYFTKASTLSNTVILYMGEEVPLSKIFINSIHF